MGQSPLEGYTGQSGEGWRRGRVKICTLSRVCIVLDHFRVIRIPDLVNFTSDLVRCLEVSNCAYECGAMFEILRNPKNVTRKIVLKVKGDTRSSHA